MESQDNNEQVIGQENHMNEPSSLPLSDQNRIDERFIDDTNLVTQRNVIQQDLTLLDNRWIKFLSQASLRNFYTEMNAKPFMEREVIPGTITFLTFAKQLKDSQIEKSFDEIRKRGTTYLFTSTVGANLSEWSIWIYSIKDEAYTDLYSQWTSPLALDIPSLFQRQIMSGEHTPEEQRSFIDQNQTDPVQIKYSAETTEPSIHESGMDETAHVYTAINEHTSNSEILDESLFIESRQPSPYQPSHEISDNNDTSGSILVHSRARNHSLAKIHETVRIPVIFTDLYLNLLNKLHNEYQSLLKTYKTVTKIQGFNDDNNLKVFKMLLIYARSTQPPFRQSKRRPDRPVLHLELFFDQLISEDRIIRDVRIELKHYIEGTVLNADRYSAIINNALQVRLKLFKAQGVQAASEDPEINEVTTVTESGSKTIVKW